MNWLRKLNSSSLDEPEHNTNYILYKGFKKVPRYIIATKLKYPLLPISGSIVAVVRKEVVIELPEHMKSYTSVRCKYIVVSFSEHGVIFIQSEELRQKFVAQFVNL